MKDIARAMMGMGLLLVILGGVLYGLGDSIKFGRLPGDFVIDRGNTKFYFPLTTSILVSIVGSVILWLIKMISQR